MYDKNLFTENYGRNGVENRCISVGKNFLIICALKCYFINIWRL